MRSNATGIQCIFPDSATAAQLSLCLWTITRQWRRPSTFSAVLATRPVCERLSLIWIQAKASNSIPPRRSVRAGNESHLGAGRLGGLPEMADAGARDG